MTPQEQALVAYGRVLGREFMGDLIDRWEDADLLALVPEEARRALLAPWAEAFINGCEQAAALSEQLAKNQGAAEHSPAWVSAHNIAAEIRALAAREAMEKP